MSQHRSDGNRVSISSGGWGQRTNRPSGSIDTSKKASMAWEIDLRDRADLQAQVLEFRQGADDNEADGCAAAARSVTAARVAKRAWWATVLFADVKGSMWDSWAGWSSSSRP
jgi:hypothetical protein